MGYSVACREVKRALSEAIPGAKFTVRTRKLGLPIVVQWSDPAVEAVKVRDICKTVRVRERVMLAGPAPAGAQ